VKSYVNGSGRDKGYRPINDVYFRLPGMSMPGDLFFGTWTKINTTYNGYNWAGRFFRMTGGNAAAFGTAQADAARNITGRYAGALMAAYPTTTDGAFSVGTGGATPGVGGGAVSLFFQQGEFNASGSTVSYPVAAENRPINYAIEAYYRSA
jgi:hypothetical protein